MRRVTSVVLVAAAFAAVVSLTGALTQQRLNRSTAGASPLARLRELPLGEQATISRTLAAGEISFRPRVVRGGFALGGGAVRGTFGRFGARFAGGSGDSVALSLAGIGRAGALMPARTPALRALGNRVFLVRGGVTESYTAGPLGIEQAFRVARRPSAGDLPVQLELAVGGATPVLHARTVQFREPLGRAALRYGGLSVVDATGRKLPGWLSVAAGRVLISVADRGARYPLTVDPFVQVAKLTASDAAAGDQLGLSVAISGGTAVVGAPEEKVGSNAQQGAVYVFSNSEGAWHSSQTEEQKLVASDGGVNDALGWSVGISGSTIVAGAPNNGGKGAVYVFTGSEGGWSQTSKLTASDGAVGDQLGYSVGIDGSTIVAGAPHAASSHGAVYVFAGLLPTQAVATQDTELVSSSPAANDDLGISVAVSGSTVVGGASGANGGTGKADVFTEPSGGWSAAAAQQTQSATLTASDGAAGDRFGYAVAVDGSTVAVGSPHATVNSVASAGRAYVYTEPAGGWSGARAQDTELAADDGGTNDVFGWSVGVAGQTVVVGAPNHLGGGAGYMFVEPGSGWSADSSMGASASLTANDAASGDQFGYSIAIAGTTVLAGARQAAVGGLSQAGAAYVVQGPAPTLTLTSPTDGSTTTSPNVTVTGNVNSLGSVSVTVNGERASVAGDGSFSVPLVLGPGKSTISAYAFGGDGQETADQTVTVTYNAPVPAVQAGRVYSFGTNEGGELGHTTNGADLGVDPTPSEVTLPGATGPAVRVAAGSFFSLVVTSTGQLYSFGDDGSSNLGYTTSGYAHPTPTLVSLPGATGPVTQVAAGEQFALAVTASGQLYGFGNNYEGQLGTTDNVGTDTSIVAPRAITLPGQVGRVVDVAAGRQFSLAVTSTGQLYAFGANDVGQLGSAASSSAQPVPARVSLPGATGPVVEVSAGSGFSLAVTSTGQLYGFGDNSDGQLGLPPAAGTTLPPTLVHLSGGTGVVTRVAAGNGHSLVVTSSGQLFAFGDNFYGQLGSSTDLGASDSVPEAVTLPGANGGVVGVAAGGTTSLAVTSSGQLFTFGGNGDGGLGYQTPTPINSTPALVRLPAGDTVDAVAQGPEAGHALVITADLAITTSSLPAGAVGSGYHGSLSASGGAAPYAWSAAGLPAGLSINASTGAITGTPTAAETTTATVTVTDDDGVAASRRAAITISAGTPRLGGLKVRAVRCSRKHCSLELRISYRLTAADTVVFSVKQRKAGRPHHKSRYVLVHGSFSHKSASGATTFTWNGKVGGHKLGRGSYQLIATPRGTRTSATTGFKIVR